MRTLITGGAGFIGSNLAARLIARGHAVTIFDNLSRPRTAYNLGWLQGLGEHGPGTLTFVEGDLRDFSALEQLAPKADTIVHLAGQVAVTTSVQNPRDDFMVNALGTLNVLEAARLAPQQPAVIYSSTNKVYGSMEEVAIVEEPTRYRYRDLPHGIDERFPIDFHSPYGCSKGAGDQYVRDYARIYGLRTTVFRQSTIYGPRQFGVEDQGWAAHFAIATLMGRPITIYGDGKQVRDMLYIDDLIDLYELAIANNERTVGQIYNVGGGMAHTISIWQEFQPLISHLAGHTVQPTSHGEWRPGDQQVCVLDTRKVERDLGWQPKTSFPTGMQRLWDWIVEHRDLFV
ncbi:NAD-dependent epimerase/dehydratase family protein [Candidatus Gracilibacteria bacterium]|nr:NAD-dependent epimerase/dehydratase family protein [Candidatus Gracilibacteria bacterium]